MAGKCSVPEVRRVREAHIEADFRETLWVRAFSHLKRKCPILRRIPKGPPPQRRSLRAAFFPSSFFAEAKKEDPQNRTSHAVTSFQHFPNKTT